MAHVFSAKPPRKQDPVLEKETAGLLQLRPHTDGLLQRASLDRPAVVWIPHGKDMIPEAWDFATSCLRPVAQTLNSTFYDTANRCFQNGIRDGTGGGWVDSSRNLVTWTSQRISATFCRTPSDINLE